MRRLILGLGVVALLGAAYALTFMRGTPPNADDVIAALRASDPGLTGAEMSLAGCRLRVNALRPVDGADAVSVTELDVDMSIFDTQTVQIATLTEDTHGVVFKRGDVSDAMLEQAEALMGALPEDVTAQADAEGVRENLTQLLGQPDGQLRFQVQAEVIEDPDGGPVQLKSSDQAARFFDFVEAVRALPAPRSYAAALTFATSEQSRETLLAGLVSFPARLQFRAASVEDARALSTVFFGYAAENCPTPVR